jgi:Ferritin-like domain
MQAAVAAALVAAPLVAAQSNIAVKGTDILNFALNLECLEAAFYSCAAYGKPLSNELLGGGPAIAPADCTAAQLTTSIAMGPDDTVRARLEM